MTRPWMPLYVADYLADTRRLTTIEHGAYILMIMEYWRNGPLNDSLAMLQQITGMSLAQWESSEQILRGFFMVRNGKWHHKRINKELQSSDIKYKKRAAAGRKGGQNKASNATAKSYQPQPQPQPHKESSSLRSLRAGARASQRTQLAENAQPVEAQINFALSAGMDSRQIHEEWAQFRDHHLKVGNTMADWKAAWRTWVRNAGKYGSVTANGHGRSNGTEGFVRSVLEDIENDKRRREKGHSEAVPVLQLDRK